MWDLRIIEMLPDLQVILLHKGLREALQALEPLNAALREHAQLSPRSLRHPLQRRAGHHVRRSPERHPAAEQEFVLGPREPPPAQMDLDGEGDGEEQLVCGEEGAADVPVEREREVRVQKLDALRQNQRALRPADRLPEELQEERQPVLVHRVDVRERGHAEEEHRGVEGHRLVGRARLVNLLLGLLRHLLLLDDVVAQVLRRPQDVDRVLVVQDVPVRTGEDVQNLLLDLVQLPPVLRALEDQSRLLLLQLRALLRDDQPEQLVFEPLPGDHEVQQRHLHRDLRQIVRVPQLGRDVELESFLVLQHVVPDAQHHHAAPSEGLPPQQRVEHRVELLAHVLQDDRGPELQAALEPTQEIIV